MAVGGLQRISEERRIGFCILYKRDLDFDPLFLSNYRGLGFVTKNCDLDDVS